MISLWFVEDPDQPVELARFSGGNVVYSDEDLRDEIATWPVQPGDPGFAAELRRRFGNSHRYVLKNS